VESVIAFATFRRKREESHIFPHRLFRWFVTKQIILSGSLIVTIYLLLTFWFNFLGTFSPRLQDALSASLAMAFLAMVAVSFFMARRLVIPLGRLIDKTRRLRKFPFESDELGESEWAYDEPGEWYDLERALNKLGEDLRKKTIRLSRDGRGQRSRISCG
jgi:hypothetical protein